MIHSHSSSAGDVDPAAAGDAGVVDQDVEPAPALLDVRERGGPVVVGGDVERAGRRRRSRSSRPVGRSTSSPARPDRRRASAPRRARSAAPVTRHPAHRRRTCRARAGRPGRGAPRRARRRAAAPGRAVHAPASGKSSDSPPPPWICIAMSMTCWAMFGHGDLDLARPRDSAFSGPPTSSFQAAFSTSSRAWSIAIRASAMRSRLPPRFDQRLAERRALEAAPAGQLERQLGQADQPHAVVDAAGAEPALGDRERLARARR